MTSVTHEPPAEPPADPPVDADEPEPAPRLVGYDQGFFLRSADDRFLLRIKGRVQPFWTYTRIEGDAPNPTAFEIRRARVILEGNVFGDDWRYRLQFDLGRGDVQLRDFHWDRRIVDDAWVRAGQWKRPFSREHITSSGRLELTDRSIIDRVFGAGRDIGVAVRNPYEESPPVEWTVGMFNGTGIEPFQIGILDPVTGEVEITNPINVPFRFRPAFIGRVGVNEGDLKGYSQADLEGGPLRWAAAASLWLEGDLDDRDETAQKLELDYIVKAHGFSSTGGLYAMTQQVGPRPLADQEFGVLGFFVQAGYMITPHWQVAARYTFIDDSIDDGDDRQELTVGASWYDHRHDAKLQVAVSIFDDPDGDFGDVVLVEVASQLGF
ncbi:MAG TPA: porin [Kofleriaceae bacterium]|nr:porin [Kofleriaceae bacterium]